MAAPSLQEALETQKGRVKRALNPTVSERDCNVPTSTLDRVTLKVYFNQVCGEFESGSADVKPQLLEPG